MNGAAPAAGEALSMLGRWVRTGVQDAARVLFSAARLRRRGLAWALSDAAVRSSAGLPRAFLEPAWGGSERPGRRKSGVSGRSWLCRPLW